MFSSCITKHTTFTMSHSTAFSLSKEHTQFLQNNYLHAYATGGRLVRRRIRQEAQVKLEDKFPDLTRLSRDDQIRLSDVSMPVRSGRGGGADRLTDCAVMA